MSKKLLMAAVLTTCFSGTAIAEGTNRTMTNVEQSVFQTIKDIPDSATIPIARSYSTQNGQCTVWVTETLRPGSPFVFDGKITFPYHVSRPNHQYNCVKNPRVN